MPKFSQITIVLVIVFMLRFDSQAIAQSDYIAALVLVDSQSVSIEKDGVSIANLAAERNAYFHRFVRYDHIAGNVSLIERTRRTPRRWRFKSIVWDYRQDKRWIVQEGESGSGEATVNPLVFRYFPQSNEAFLQIYGWEGFGVARLANGIEENIVNLPVGYVKILASISRDSMVVSLHSDDPEIPADFYLYCWKTQSVTKLSQETLRQYHTIILRDSGRNILYRESQPFYEKKQFFGNIYWNPQGTAFIFTKYDPMKKANDKLYIYDFPRKTRKLISENHIGYAVVWSEEASPR